jgi:hypothetical protein
MTEAALLHWVDVEAYCSWCHAKGRAGEYRITWSFSEPGQCLSTPDGKSQQFETRDFAKLAAEKFEREYRAEFPEELTLGRFWMVYGIDQRSPSRKHFSEENARREARRLAESNPQITFVVLETTTAYRSERPTVNQFTMVTRSPRDIDDDLPF